jgi:hypothetical protein|tara:strand:+ start:1752 stop:2069 length:318 start_codon:yes stop_codon:yes gene_type:complete
MDYLKWRLSEGTTGTGPEEAIADHGGAVETSWAVDGSGYRIGYLTQPVVYPVSSPVSRLLDGSIEPALHHWDVTEVTEAEALTFAQSIWADAEVLSDGRLSTPPE